MGVELALATACIPTEGIHLEIWKLLQMEKVAKLLQDDAKVAEICAIYRIRAHYQFERDEWHGEWSAYLYYNWYKFLHLVATGTKESQECNDRQLGLDDLEKLSDLCAKTQSPHDCKGGVKITYR